MKRAKKLLVTLLVLTFVLSIMSVGFAAEEEKLPSEVIRAQALDILRGDDQGNLNLDKPITRAEALALVIRISGLESSAELMKGQTIFSDVSSDPGLQWATGYINLGVGQGIINGYPDGTFKGRNTVTYAEMAKMLLYAMNYGVTVEGAPWPAGVMGKADDLDLFDGVNALPDVPALRGDVVKMIDSALTISHLKQVGYGDLKQYEEDPDTTFLSKMDVDELKGVRVTEIARVNDKLYDNEIELTEYDKDGDVVDSEIYTLIADVNPEEIFGLEVDAWVNDDDEVFFVNVKTAEKDILLDTVKESDDDEITLKDADKTYDWAEGAIAYVNFKSVDLDEIDVNAYGKVVLDRGDVAFVNLFEFDDVGVVTEVDGDVIEFVNDSANKDEIDLDDFDDVYV
ncbi:MAG: S-layer homology domain-containing protein, partial [Thermoanaerobacterales bacterium]|nr:S-layer homology domain-containing protein [Thermoanaerobacterales bacterium]